MLLFALLISDAKSLTLPATLLVVAGALSIWLIAKYAPPPSTAPIGDTPVPRTGVVAWAAVFIVFSLWEATAFLVGNNDAHPTFSMLSDPVLSWGPTRALCGFLWLAAGWCLVARRPYVD